ncbi:helix-turn-helix domain-containing protein [Rickettsiella endosymbiont of Dermanyssus gallinae]|uniref:helix-turn-helix domain-containing protein n=1 Tax=Rickettsiella endosymbiont of Dermanyssus gallinae TaxID=2856608 RepID=UPI001C52C596|nr:helix-turn-helix transcriptional regulator [Rickettsiella endosymbiont of Dermanyssus gallinae]
MEHDVFELFLRECKTQEKAADILKVSQSYISKMRSGERKICFDLAKKITDYLQKKLDVVISPEKLISRIEKNKKELSNSTLFYNIPIKFSPINLEIIKTSFDKNCPQSNEKIDLERFIIVDEFYYLISDEETYFHYLNSNKKIVKGCKICLQKLINMGLDKSIIAYISNTFDLIERTKIAQRVEGLAGNRRGKPLKKGLNVDNLPHLVLPRGVKTRDFAADLCGLGEGTYRKLKKIIEHDDEGLIDQVRCEEITPHAAYQKILTIEPKPSFSFPSSFNR